MNCIGTWTVYHRRLLSEILWTDAEYGKYADPEIRRVSKPGPEPIYPAYVVM